MNSLVSYDWLKEYVDLKGITPDEFAKRISLSGPGVEKIIPQGKDLEKVVVGQVLEVKKHPNADKLRLAVVDVGSKVSIVCGGSNLEKDQWVAVALVGAKVKWHGEGELIELKPIEIRGVASEGMICAANEIGLFDAFPHAEREILDLGVALPEMKLKPGTPLADALGLSSDVVMDIEVTSNRVDAMGMVGMAREAAAILRRKFSWTSPKMPKAKGVAPKVKISAKFQCPRYMAVKMEGVTVGPSPWWMKRRLLSAGLRPINNLVDISNYVMLELAQPTHMFDASMVNGGIDVRLAQRGEKIKALDGKTYDLDDSILIIADSGQPIAIAGVMGGELSGVASNTTSIIIEAAIFDPVVIRCGARKLNVQSDAQLRFEKGLSTAAPPEALAEIVKLVQELAGGKVAGGVADVGKTTYKPLSFSVTTDEVTSLIGVAVPKTEMLDILRRLGFQLSSAGKKITAKVPWWRDHDIEDGRDLVEEIARVQGYANIPPVVPVGMATRPKDKELSWEKHVRCISKGAGLTEVYTYSFVSKDLLAKAEYDASAMLHVQNPLSSDFEVMRTTLLPSLLQVASENRERFAEQRLFEVSNVYYPKAVGWKDLPDEQLEIGALFMGMPHPWRVAKGYVEHVLNQMGIKEISWRRLSDDSFWHPGRSVQAFYKEDLVATLGEVSPRIAKNFKLDGPVALVDIPLEMILQFATNSRVYTPPSPFPEAKRDLAVVVDARSEYDDLARAIRHVDPLVTDVEWFDTYIGKNLPEGKKSVAMHITFSSNERTLESAEVDGLMEKATLALKEKFKAEVRG
ncbi:MAG: phenylalanine--tRNA ligase subunit beta [Patescibacteria group bacterium]